MAQHETVDGVRFLVDTAAARGSESFVRAAAQHREVAGALSGHRWRLLHVLPVEEWDATRGQHVCREREAVFYDYSRNCVVRARGGATGAGPFRLQGAYEQPHPSLEEFQAAVALVAQSPVWGNLLQSGYVQPYEPMPPVLEPEGDEPVERTLYVGLISRPRRFNRIVAVNMVRLEVSREAVIPRNSRAVEQICGVDAVDCNRPPRGAAGSAVIQWPASRPLWVMRVVRPAGSSGTNASGLELRNVQYRGKLVLKQAHVPILNVRYDGDACGPYRDWLYAESCFQAVGRSIAGAPGFRRCSQPPQTIMESGKDGGNFTGVAVYDTSDGALGLVSQMMAGWYRYIMKWSFYPDGRIAARFGFDGVADSCVCITHHHHALWRFDFDVVEPANVVEELVDGTWRSIPRETSRRRQEDLGPRWRVRHARTGAGYEIQPGPNDGIGDDFSGPDLLALRYHPNREIDDGRTLVGGNASTNLLPFLNNEPVSGQDLVVWYGAHFRHAVSEEPDPNANDHHEVGPTLQPFNWPGA
jgi:hypothetical protein